MNELKEPNMRLDTAIFYTKDFNKVVSFYTDIIGLELEAKNGEYYASFTFDNGSKLGIKVADKNREEPGKQTIILSVDDVESLYKELKDQEVEFYDELEKHDWGYHFSILDPDGNKVEFVQR